MSKQPQAALAGLFVCALAASTAYSVRARAETVTAGHFSGVAAHRWLSELVTHPRHHEAPGRSRALDFIVRASRPHAEVTLQRFEGIERGGGKRTPLINILARQNPDTAVRILLGTHWDSRSWAEQDPDPGRRGKPITGANDSGSGTAVLVELMRHTGTLTGVGIDYVFFDGEELGRPGHDDDYCQGSQYFARTLAATYPGNKPQAAVIIDMVGDRDLDLYHEVSSIRQAPSLVAELWGIARQIAAPGWHPTARHHIVDDHTALQRLGIPAALVIDYDYPHWHTHRDTLDKVSPESLASVGRVLQRFAETRAADARTAPPAPPALPGSGLPFETTSAFSHFLIRDEGSRRSLYFRRDSGELVLESQINPQEPHRLQIPYTRAMFLSYLFRPKPAHALLVGLGGGSMVHFIRHHDPALRIDVVEIDPAIVDAAQKWFGVKADEKTRLITADAFAFLTSTTETYDVIYLDAFLKPSSDTDATGVPLRMKTVKFLKSAVAGKLAAGGVAVFNINRGPSLAEDLWLLAQTFAQTYWFPVPQSMNFVVVGTAAKKRLGKASLARAAVAIDARLKADFSFQRMADWLFEPPKPTR